MKYFNMMSTLTLGLLLMVGTADFSRASDSHHHHRSVHHGSLMLKDIRVRALMPGAKVSAGYLEIMNHGSDDDRLKSVSIIGANKAEIHNMIIDNGVMKMRPLKDGIEIPAGGHVSLAPGGFHLMFMKLGDFPKKGEMATLSLEFEKAGSITIKAPVMMIKSNHGHSGHSH